MLRGNYSEWLAVIHREMNWTMWEKQVERSNTTGRDHLEKVALGKVNWVKCYTEENLKLSERETRGKSRSVAFGGGGAKLDWNECTSYWKIGGCI